MALFILLTQNAFVFESIPDMVSLLIHLIYSCLLDQHSPMHIAEPVRASLLLVNIMASYYIWIMMEIPAWSFIDVIPWDNFNALLFWS